jgi:dTMP kinase
MQKPLLIVFEGIDGCGKSTQAELLVAFLQRHNKPTRLVHFPNYTSATGRQIAKHLRGEKKATPSQMAVLYAKDKYAGSMEINSMLKSGFNVIVDRYTASNCAYQSARMKGTVAEKESFMRWVIKLEALLPKPDATFIIDVNPVLAFRNNLEKRGRKYLQDKADVYEKDIGFQKLVRAQYLACAKILKPNTYVINAMAARKMATRQAVASRVLLRLRKSGLLAKSALPKGK